MKVVLGINAYHADSAACLLIDGIPVAAAEEERFCRIKHWAGFPSQAIQYCLTSTGVRWGDIENVAINRDPSANFLRKLAFVAGQRPEPRLLLERLKQRRGWSSIGDMIRGLEHGHEFRGQIHAVEHHLAHIGSTFLVSPFEQAVALSIDGMGDFASAAWGVCQSSRIEIKGRVFSPHSLGIFYEAMTQYLGFPNYGDEYKVMGLAAYGEPRYLDQMHQIIKRAADDTYRLDMRFFRHHKESVGYTWNGVAPGSNRLFTTDLERLLGPARTSAEPLEQVHRDIARSIQVTYEEALFALLNRLHRSYPLESLALAGGCAMNSVANGKINQNTPYQRVYVQAAAGDAGGALGAASVIWHQLSGQERKFVMTHANLGPEFSHAYIGALLRERRHDLDAQGCRTEMFETPGPLVQRIAGEIAAGRVVGWFQGRMEWGPRALGNRSILCDPRRSDIKALLNAKIKRRESFRPFAPSIAREEVANWFEQDGDVPFMSQVFQVRTEKRNLVPAVTHVDGSGRLQTVTQDSNPLYYGLIMAFRDLTGVPMILNTSFNENEPIVCRPEEALDCFLRTRMDCLVLGPYFVHRVEQSDPCAVGVSV